MRRLAKFSIGLGGLAALAAGAWVLHQQRTPSVRSSEQWAMLDRYCEGCHNDAERAGDLALDKLDPSHLGADAATWEKVIRKLRGGLMPPAGEPRPDPERLETFVGFLEGSLDAAARAAPNPGTPGLRRLNRTEYANAVRDLVALPVDAAAFLPGDDSVGGFDNVGSALSISPTLLQAYVGAAATLSRLAVGDPNASPTLTTYRAPRDWQSGNHIDGQPLGTRGGFQVEHVFPLDGEYEFRLSARTDDEVQITIDGQRAAVLPSTGPRNARVATVAVAAGPRTLGVALIRRHDTEGVDDLFAVHQESPGIPSFTVNGPVGATGPGETPSRQRIFSCLPSTPAEEPACAARILEDLATRAYRRPVAVGDPSHATLLEFYAAGRAGGSFDAGIQRALARLLVDPEFIFRIESEPAELAAGAIYRVSDIDLASRLSFFLWSSIPDAELLAAAAGGTLHEPAVLEREVQRMLADPKAEALVTSFAAQWLQLRQLDAVSPETRAFDGNLREALRKETELFFTSIVREDRSVVDLIDADYTFVDERLAQHYGLPQIRGSRFRRVELPPSSPRRGLLGQGSFLTLTSAPNRTSPVKRGQWVLNNLLGTPAPQPPANVETNLEETAPAGAATTMRERLEQHQSNPSCAMCHSLIDPLGFSLENFDSIGAWRDTEAGRTVDAHGSFIDGSTLDGIAGLRSFVLERRELFVAAFTERLLTYALGRTLEPYDMPVVRAIVRTAAKDNYKFSALVQGIVASEPMRFRMKQPGDEPQQARANESIAR
jgi:hypothetical protein